MEEGVGASMEEQVKELQWKKGARIKQRLALYHGIMSIYMQFSNDAEETFSRALKLLLVSKVHG
ncbi:hypothetical protein JHK87_015929 [Glycine soja]|nr:hypothetical protein JHK87_015929 [Glycine soja]